MSTRLWVYVDKHGYSLISLLSLCLSVIFSHLSVFISSFLHLFFNLSLFFEITYEMHIDFQVIYRYYEEICSMLEMMEESKKIGEIVVQRNSKHVFMWILEHKSFWFDLHLKSQPSDVKISSRAQTFIVSWFSEQK